jgi:hypothetical protein
MAKDPAALFYIDKWLVATKEMKADCRGWFLNLLLHQFDKGDLPNNMEELANLADVRISEYDRFKEVFEQVLKHKFKQNDNGRLENVVAKEIMKAREVFKEKREEAGKMSYFIRYIRKNFTQDENLIHFIKKKVDLSDVDLKNEQLIEHLFKHNSELYINVNKNINVNVNVNNNIDSKWGVGEKEIMEETFIVVEEEKIFESKLSEWVTRNFSLQKPHWQKHFPLVPFDDALKEFIKTKAYESFKDYSHFKNSLAKIFIKLQEQNNGKKNGPNGNKKGLNSTIQVNTGKSMGKF